MFLLAEMEVMGTTLACKRLHNKAWGNGKFLREIREPGTGELLENASDCTMLAKVVSGEEVACA
jgi:hypothetical protein